VLPRYGVGKTISIKQFPPELEIEAKGSDTGIIWLLEPSQRQLLAWFAREKPEMVREAMGVDKVIEELERRLASSKKDVQGFTDHEAAYTDGKEAGLEQAIALMKGEVGK
jgi:hypothetical protein